MEPASDRLGPLLARVAVRSARHARAVLLVAFALCAAGVSWSLGHLAIDTDRNAMFSDELPFRREEDRVDREFPRRVDQLVLVVDAPTPESARRVARALVTRLEAEDELFASVDAPRTDPFFERNALLYLDLDELYALSDRMAAIQPFLGRLTRDESLRGLFDMLSRALEARGEGREIELEPVLARLAAAVRAAAEDRPHEMSWRELFGAGDGGPDERREFVLVQPRLDYGKLFPAGAAIERIRAVASELAAGGEQGARVRITGGLALSHEELVTVLHGSEVIGALVFVMVGAVLILALRSRALVAATLLTLVAGLSLTGTFAVLAVGHLNMISIAFGILYLGLGVDYAIHFGLRYRELLEEGEAHLAALEQSARDVGGSLFVCALTTAIGFYAFVPTDFVGVSELGVISGTGMFFSLAVTFTVLPALLSTRLLAVRLSGRAPTHSRIRDGLMRLTLGHPRAVAGLAALLAVASLALVPRLGFDPNPLSLRDPAAESVTTFEELLATSRLPPWSLTDLAADRDAARAAQDAFGALPEVASAVSLHGLVPAEQDAKLEVIGELALVLGLDLAPAGGAEPPTEAEERAASDELEAALAAYLATEPGRGDAAARDLADALATLRTVLDAAPERSAATLSELEHSVLATLDENLALLADALRAKGVALDDLPPERVADWVGASGLWRVEAFPAGDLNDFDVLRRLVDAGRTVDPDVTGAPVTILESGDTVVAAFRQALSIATLAAAVMLILLLRSAVDTLLVLAPLLLAALLTVAGMVVGGIAFNFANVIGLPLLLGMGIDSGVHMVHRFRAGMRADLLASSTARGVVFSSLTTLCSFVNLSLSSHRGLASMGIVLTIGIAASLLCTLVVLPALLAWREGSGEPR